MDINVSGVFWATQLKCRPGLPDFSCANIPKTLTNVPSGHKLYHMAKCRKVHILKFSVPRSSEIYYNLYFWYADKASGKPADGLW